jgi:fucose permease
MKNKRNALIVLSFIAFISLGLPDGLLGVAWPSIRRSFGLPLDALGLFLIFGTVGYMTSSFFSGALVRILGLGTLLAASCAATGIALGVYSIAPNWWVFVSFALLGGAGAGAIDAGLNNYIARNHSERLMQWLHASFGVGITMGPAIMTTVLGLMGRWQPGYRIVSGAQLLLAVAFLSTRKLWEHGKHPSVTAPVTVSASETSIMRSILHLPSLVGMMLFFTYTGAELGLGTWAYTLLTESRGINPTLAGVITGGYWASFTIGRILAGIFGGRIGLQRLVGGSIALAAVGVFLVWLNLGPVPTVVGIAVTGFVIAPVFPGMMSDTRRRVDERHHSNTIGMQIAGAGLGGAVLPSLAGVVAKAHGLEAIPVYLFVVLAVLLVLFIGSHILHRPTA